MNNFINQMNRLPLYHKPKLSFIKQTFLSNLFSIFHQTYTDLDMSSITYSIIKNKSATLARINEDLKDVSPEITEYIKSHTLYDLQLQYQKGEVNIIIIFSLFSDNKKDLDTYKRFGPWIIHWFSICYQFSEKKCKYPVRAHLYLTPFEKKIPSTGILNEKHANTAFTWKCIPDNKIIIYRREEWFKVLLHESFHYFNFENFKVSDENRLKECFPLDVRLEIGEAYGEFWARTLNCFYQAYFIDKEHSRKINVLNHFYRLMYIERIFSIYQAVKILKYMKISYIDLYAKTQKGDLIRKEYKEHTNIFCYYVITSVLMNEYQGLMEWCYKNNKDDLFNIHISNSHLFIDYLKNICKTPSLLHNINVLSNSFNLNTNHSLRMTILDFL